MEKPKAFDWFLLGVVVAAIIIAGLIGWLH
jgi:hypothetical protein